MIIMRSSIREIQVVCCHVQSTFEFNLAFWKLNCWSEELLEVCCSPPMVERKLKYIMLLQRSNNIEVLKSKQQLQVITWRGSRVSFSLPDLFSFHVTKGKITFAYMMVLLAISEQTLEWGFSIIQLPSLPGKRATCDALEWFTRCFLTRWVSDVAFCFNLIENNQW